jgi:hypothetical protein
MPTSKEDGGGAGCRIRLRGGLPGKEDAKRIQGFTNQWSIYNKYPSFIDNEDITCKWNTCHGNK